jgi:hypothetical protein
MNKPGAAQVARAKRLLAAEGNSGLPQGRPGEGVPFGTY